MGIMDWWMHCSLVDASYHINSWMNPVVHLHAVSASPVHCPDGVRKQVVRLASAADVYIELGLITLLL